MTLGARKRHVFLSNVPFPSFASCVRFYVPLTHFFLPICSVSKPVTRLDSFAFEQGGSLTINGGLTNHENDLPRQLLKFYLCTEREFTSLPSDSFALELDCQRPEYTTRCTAGELLNHTTIQIPIATTQRYRFLLVHCSETPGTLRAPLVNAAISYTGTTQQSLRAFRRLHFLDSFPLLSCHFPL